MTLVTNTEVFNFVGAPADIVSDEGSNVTTLISNVENEVEGLIGRKLESETFTDVIFQDRLNCDIFGDRIFFKGIYRDIYSITSITENGLSLDSVSDYNDGNDYFLDVSRGVVIRNESFWSIEPFSIKASGSLGIGGASGAIELKQAIIEIVAARSGLWRVNVETEGGRVETIRTTTSESTMKLIKSYRLGSF